ncbi:hypothetical protein D9603_06115 [Pseudoalteromonas sp. PS5]|nr:hypothetical protein D9603_06115 [Pseudoalteromonas sp. PS5]
MCTVISLQFSCGFIAFNRNDLLLLSAIEENEISQLVIPEYFIFRYIARSVKRLFALIYLYTGLIVVALFIALS